MERRKAADTIIGGFSADEDKTTYTRLGEDLQQKKIALGKGWKDETGVGD